MNAFDPNAYGPAVADLLAGPRLPALGPGSPVRAAEPLLRSFDPATAIPGLRDRAMGQACLAGLWLYHDFLDESHSISQELSGPTGSYWHGIMHRREPDAGNSKYWFRQVGTHPVFAQLAKDADELGAQSEAGPEAAFLRGGRAWDPFSFIDLCEAHRGTGDAAEMLCRRVQLREWELLFDWCYRKAVGE